MKTLEELKPALLAELKPLALERYCEPLLHYLALLNKWNQAYNLTAIRDPGLMIHKHLVDSLAILPWIKGSNLIDIGTGAGLPGIPIAITRPDLAITLLDSNGKKIRFLREVKRRLGLDNVEIVESRAESYHPARNFDTVTTRAFSSLTQMINWTKHLIAEEGLWLAMKGVYPQEELEMLQQPWRIEHYQLDAVEGERCSVLINNTKEPS